MSWFAPFWSCLKLSLLQNSFAMCWILLHLLLLQWSGVPKDPGGGITTFDFIVNKFEGEMAASLVQRFQWSVVWNPLLLLPLSSKCLGLHHLSWIHEFWVVIPILPLLTCLVLPNSTKVTPSWWILLSDYLIITQILQESSNFILIDLQEAFTELFLCSNEITPIIRPQHSQISTPSNKPS